MYHYIVAVHLARNDIEGVSSAVDRSDDIVLWSD